MNGDFFNLINEAQKIAKKKILSEYAPCGRCRELIRMIDNRNLKTKVMINEDKILELEQLLPEMYISKERE